MEDFDVESFLLPLSPGSEHSPVAVGECDTSQSPFAHKQGRASKRRARRAQRKKYVGEHSGQTIAHIEDREIDGGFIVQTIIGPQNLIVKHRYDSRTQTLDLSFHDVETIHEPSYLRYVCDHPVKRLILDDSTISHLPPRLLEDEALTYVSVVRTPIAENPDLERLIGLACRNRGIKKLQQMHETVLSGGDPEKFVVAWDGLRHVYMSCRPSLLEVIGAPEANKVSCIIQRLLMNCFESMCKRRHGKIKITTC